MVGPYSQDLGPYFSMVGPYISIAGSVYFYSGSVFSKEIQIYQNYKFKTIEEAGSVFSIDFKIYTDPAPHLIFAYVFHK